jgi:dTMP kinase
LFLDISTEKARERGGYGEERYEKEELQRKVRARFSEISQEFSADKWVTIDAGRDKEAVASDVWNCAEPFAGGVVSPLQRLWTHDT